MQAMSSLYPNDLDPRHERLLAIAVILLACAAIGATLWRYLPGWIGPDPLAAVESGDTAADTTRAETLPNLAGYGLFGASPGGDAEGQLALPINAPQTNLDLTLRGTLAAEAPENALAIIADGEDVERTYAVGAELPGGAVLHRVHRDRAILRRSGNLETLPLRDPERKAVDGDGWANNRTTGNGRDGSRTTGDPGDLARTAERLRNDPEQLARQFSAVPVQEDGQLIGVRLRAHNDSALLSRVGLRASDVLTAVNGVPLNDFSRANEVMSQLQSGTDFQVTVLRNGREQQVNVSLND